MPLHTVSDYIPSNTDQVLSINPSAVFVFEDFNIHHRNWLTYSGGTNTPEYLLGTSAIPPLFNDLEVLPSASDKATLFAENYSKNSNLDDSGISLPVFPSRTTLKLHNIYVTSKMVKKVITNLNLSKVSGPDYILVVLLKNCEPELSYRLAELFNKCLPESCFPDCWKVSLVVTIFENVGGKVYKQKLLPCQLSFRGL